MAVVLITGCSTGIGYETALAFARRGDTTVATMRNLAKAEPLQKQAAAEGLDVDLVELDVCDDGSVARAVADVLGRHGRIDVLVNNAGVGYGGPVETIDPARARALVETNFWGPLRMIQAVVPGMRERGEGVVVNVTSVAGRVHGAPFQGLYAASKHALGTLSESLWNEVAHRGVRVVCIEPGFFVTAITENSAEDIDPASPYAADETWMTTFMTSNMEQGGGHPSVVADAIVAASTDPATPLHVPVGADAEMFIALAAQAGTPERWLEMALPLVESVAGPRPPA